MAEPVTALTAPFRGPRHIEDAGPTGMITLRGDLASGAEVGPR